MSLRYKSPSILVINNTVVNGSNAEQDETARNENHDPDVVGLKACHMDSHS